MIGHPLLHVGVGHGGGLPDVGGRQAHELDVHLLAVLAVAILDLGVADRHAVDDEPAHATIHQVLPHLTLELAAVTVDLQDALEQLAVEAAVLLQLRHVGDGGHHLVVADVEPEALRFVPQQRVVDQLVERLSAEVETGRQRGATEHLLEATLELLRLLVELAARDALPVHPRDDVELLLARGADAPADERDGEQRVENLDAAGGRIFPQVLEHGGSSEEG